jgi:hypothetical protein
MMQSFFISLIMQLIFATPELRMRQFKAAWERFATATEQRDAWWRSAAAGNTGTRIGSWAFGTSLPHRFHLGRTALPNG